LARLPLNLAGRAGLLGREGNTEGKSSTLGKAFRRAKDVTATVGPRKSLANVKGTFERLEQCCGERPYMAEPVSCRRTKTIGSVHPLTHMYESKCLVVSYGIQ
jgi:hypothetical protein